jgi:hypothetical protein
MYNTNGAPWNPAFVKGHPRAHQQTELWLEMAVVADLRPRQCALIAYDAMGAAYAFSPFGFTGAYAGFSDTELARSNTGFKYRVEYGNFRAAGLAQVGGYNIGNGSASMWQGQIGGDIPNLFGGTLSLDAIGSYAKDGVNTSIFNGTCAVLKSGPFIGQTGCTDAIPEVV